MDRLGGFGTFTDLVVAAGASLTFNEGFPYLKPSQTLRGNGTVAGNADIRGTLAPGVGGPGILTFDNGSYVYVSFNGTEQMELGGTVAGTGHDRVEVSGSFDLLFAGTLTASLINVFTPIVGDSIKLFNTSGGIDYSLASSFATVILPPLGAGMGWRVDYNAFDISLVVTGAPPTATRPMPSRSPPPNAASATTPTATRTCSNTSPAETRPTPARRRR